nr:hypothetical protein BaRGS_022133 [Batillaria attramentaria]
MKCTNCTHFPFPKLSKEIKNVCRVNERDNSSVVELVVLIASQPENFQGRLALRQTWLQISKRNKSKVRYLFLVGKPAKGPDQKKLEVEKKKHRDILQTTSQDAFNKQTEKMMIGLKWVTRHCRHARHVLKTEDDVWVNVPALLNWLKAQPLRQPFGVGGFCAPSNTPDRNPLSKYFIPKSIYPQEFYPPFCNAPGYLLTPHTARQVERMSKDVPYFPFDDVYLGFCLQAIRMQVQRVPGFSNDKMAMKTDSDKCRLLGKSVLLTHGREKKRHNANPNSIL